MTLKTKFDVGNRVWAFRDGYRSFYEYKIMSIPEWFDQSGFNYIVRHEDEEEIFEELKNEDDLYQYKQDLVDIAFKPYVEQEEPIEE